MNQGTLGVLFNEDDDLLAAIERRKETIREKRERRFREIETECSDALGRLDLAIDAIRGGGRGVRRKQSEPAPASPQKRSKRRRRSSASTSPAAYEERCTAVHRYLVEAGGPVAPREIQRELDLTPSCVQSATLRLCRDGKATRTGSGIGTRYVAKPRAGFPATARSRDRSTLGGLILETLEERGYASATELAQATGASLERIEAELSASVAQQEVRLDQRNGRPVFVPHKPV